MGTHDTIYTATSLPCARCQQLKPIACCWCDMELCQDCAPIHGAQCEYAKRLKFRTWTPRKERGEKA